MKAGFAKNDITPRVGVELCGFGPFLCRHSIGVHDRLWARAMVAEQNDTKVALISCDLVGTSRMVTRRVRSLVSGATGIPEDAIMLHCTHTHSGPNIADYIGWGERDEPYIETIPQRIALAAIQADKNMAESAFLYTEAPCVGIGLNREYERDAPPLEEVLKDDWLPKKPELTDTTCHVVEVRSKGKRTGFLSYFGCHPVVCCDANRYIHGDYCGVATNMLEREKPGTVGLFLQGAQGDVNSCVCHKPEQESLLALDIIASRYANQVRKGLDDAKPIDVDDIRYCFREVVFSRKPWDLAELKRRLSESEKKLGMIEAKEAEWDVRMETVYAIALRRLVAIAERGETLSPPTEIQGLRIGPLAFLGTPFEVFQAVKNDVCKQAASPIPLVMGLTNDSVGYAVDNTTSKRGGYAAEMVPLIIGSIPFSNTHQELLEELVKLDSNLQ